jgi:hypothetical protein
MTFLAASLTSPALQEAPNEQALAGAANIVRNTARMLQRAIDLIWPREPHAGESGCAMRPQARVDPGTPDHWWSRRWDPSPKRRASSPGKRSPSCDSSVSIGLKSQARCAMPHGRHAGRGAPTRPAARADAERGDGKAAEALARRSRCGSSRTSAACSGSVRLWHGPGGIAGGTSQEQVVAGACFYPHECAAAVGTQRKLDPIRAPVR